MKRLRRSPDRLGPIVHYLSQVERASVFQLSRHFGVSEVSIRRDLERLEQMGLLRRVHGGAEFIARPGQVSLFEARLLEHADVKARIGQTAAALIQPGDTILLDSGTTVLEVARHISPALLDTGGLTVVTRSLVIAHELRVYRGVRLIVLGGVYLHDFDDFVGAQVEHALGELHVRLLFIGTDGVSMERGLTTGNVLEAGLYRQMARSAESVVVVTDSSKIGLDKLQMTLSFEEIDLFISDPGVPPEFVEMLRSQGVETIVAPDDRAEQGQK